MEELKSVLANIGQILIPVVLLGLILYGRRKGTLRFGRVKENRVKYDTTPILVSILAGELINGASGETANGYPYIFIVGGTNLLSNEGNIGVYCIELPFESGVHLVGAPKQTQQQFDLGLRESGKFEPVTLEGDYNNYFNLYAQNGEQTETRYVLDPAAMVFTIDFCSQYYWEIQGDSLYLISMHDSPSFDLVDQFIDEIRPAVEIPSGRTGDAERLSYTHTTSRAMNCPRCNARLEIGEICMQCPRGDGYLITGEQILRARSVDKSLLVTEMTNIEKTETETTANATKLQCPYCGSDMNPSTYQNTNIIINVCTHCPYRWVDKNEITAIIGKAV